MILKGLFLIAKCYKNLFWKLLESKEFFMWIILCVILLENIVAEIIYMANLVII